MVRKNTHNILLVDIPFALMKLDPRPLEPFKEIQHQLHAHFRESICKHEGRRNPKNVLATEKLLAGGALWSPETLILAALSLFMAALTPAFSVAALRLALE